MTEMSADVCLLDYKAFLENGDILLKWKDENNIKFIFITSDIKDIIDIMQNHPEQYLILSPVEEESLIKVFENLKLRIKRIAIIAKLAHQEDKRIYVKDLNYINITKRNLRYHLADGREYDSQTLRQSFSKEISPLLIKPELYFIQPSLLVNMTNIETLWDDHMQFENGDVFRVYALRLASDNKAFTRYDALIPYEGSLVQEKGEGLMNWDAVPKENWAWSFDGEKIILNGMATSNMVFVVLKVKH